MKTPALLLIICALLAACGKAPEAVAPAEPGPSWDWSRPGPPLPPISRSLTAVPVPVADYPVTGAWDVRIWTGKNVLLQIDDDHGVLTGTLSNLGDVLPSQAGLHPTTAWPLKGIRNRDAFQFTCEEPGVRAVFSGSADAMGFMNGTVIYFTSQPSTASKWRWQGTRRIVHLAQVGPVAR